MALELGKKSVQVYLRFQKVEPSYESTILSLTIQANLLVEKDDRFLFLLDDSDYEQCHNFCRQTILDNCIFQGYYILIEGTFYQANTMEFDYESRVMTFKYYEKFPQNPYAQSLGLS